MLFAILCLCTAFHKHQRVSFTALAACLTSAISQCSTSLPDHSTASALWTACSHIHIEAALCKLTASDLCQLLAELRIAESLLELLASLLPMMLPKVSSSQQGGSSNNNPNHRVANTVRSHADTASRAKRVLWDRRMARSGPFPSDLICVLGCTLQLLDAISVFVGNEIPSDLPDFESTLVSSLAETLLQQGLLLQHLDTALAFLLRCVRNRVPEPDTAPAAFLPTATSLQYASQHLCLLCSHVFLVTTAMDETAQLELVCRLPARFIDKLCCVVCEALPATDSAVWEVSQLIVDGGLTEWITLADYEEDEQLSSEVKAIRYVPAMHVVSRRALSHAVASDEQLEYALNRAKAMHPQLAMDHLLSLHIRNCWHWQWPDAVQRSPTLAAGLPSVPGSDKWYSSSSDSYFLPRVRDTSVHELAKVLAKETRLLDPESGQPVCTTMDSVYMSKMVAVLLSLQKSRMVAVAAAEEQRSHTMDPDLQRALVRFARFTSALTSHLLRGLEAGHTTCDCSFSDGEVDIAEGEAAVKRAAARDVCQPCSGLAEGILAMLLQMLALHSFVYRRKDGVEASKEGECQCFINQTLSCFESPFLELRAIWCCVEHSINGFNHCEHSLHYMQAVN